MALEFYKRRFRKPGKKLQYFLAFTALLLVLASVLCWGIIRYQFEKMQEPESSNPDNSVALPETTFTAADKGNLLFVVNGDADTHFYWLQSDPARRAAYLTTLPQNLIIDGEATLIDVYRKSGAPRAASALRSTLEIGDIHYMTVTAANAEKWYQNHKDALLFTTTQNISLRDTVIKAGAHPLTATQATELLQTNDHGGTVLATTINQYMRADCSVVAEFAALANLVHTDLRIGDLNGYREALTMLTKNNTGSLCTQLSLPTQTTNGKCRLASNARAELACLYE